MSISDGLLEAINNDSADLSQFKEELTGLPAQRDAMEHAIKHGKLNSFNHLCTENYGVLIDEKRLAKATLYGYVEIVRKMIELFKESLSERKREGNPDRLLYDLKKRFITSYEPERYERVDERQAVMLDPELRANEAFHNALENGHIEVAELLLVELNEDDKKRIIDETAKGSFFEAACRGKVASLDWIYRQRPELITEDYLVIRLKDFARYATVDALIKIKSLLSPERWKESMERDNYQIWENILSAENMKFFIADIPSDQKKEVLLAKADVLLKVIMSSHDVELFYELVDLVPNNDNILRHQQRISSAVQSFVESSSTDNLRMIKNRVSPQQWIGIIAQDDYSIMRQSLSAEMTKFIIAGIPQEDKRDALLTNADALLRTIKNYADIEIFRELLSVMPDDERREEAVRRCRQDVLSEFRSGKEMEMISQIISDTPRQGLNDLLSDSKCFSSKSVATFLAVTLGDEDGRDHGDDHVILNEDKIAHLRKMREQLIEQFSKNNADPDAGVRKADIAIAHFLQPKWHHDKNRDTNLLEDAKDYANSIHLTKGLNKLTGLPEDILLQEIASNFVVVNSKLLSDQENKIAMKVLVNYISKPEQLSPEQPQQEVREGDIREADLASARTSSPVPQKGSVSKFLDIILCRTESVSSENDGRPR